MRRSGRGFVGLVLVGGLAGGCDALLPARDEPAERVAAAPVPPATAPAEAVAEVVPPARDAGTPAHRRPVEPGHLAPPIAGASATERPGETPVAGEAGASATERPGETPVAGEAGASATERPGETPVAGEAGASATERPGETPVAGEAGASATERPGETPVAGEAGASATERSAAGEAGAAVGAGDERPAWARLLDESRALAAAGRWEDVYAAQAKEREAFAAIRALPEVDPRFVEAQCVLARRVQVGAEAEEALLRALARLRAHAPAEFDPYAHLDRDDLITTTLGASIAEDGAVTLHPSNGLTSAGDCGAADVALLTTLLIDGYHSYGMFRRAHDDVLPPAVEDPFKAASRALLDLHAELVRAYGAKHARPAALVERHYYACHGSHRKKHPKVCYLEKDEPRVYALALAARVATYGEDHPLTRASLLRVGVERLAAGEPEAAGELLARAMAGELDGASKATAAAIVAAMALQAGRVDEGLALLGRVEAAGARAFGGDAWALGAVLQFHADALKVHGRPREALRVFRKYMATQTAGGSTRELPPLPGHAELLTAAGEHEAARSEYGRRLAEAERLERTGANERARQTGREQRLADLRARAEVRRALGDAAGAEADLAEARRVEAGPPVAGD